MINLTALSYKDTSDGSEEALVKKDVAVNPRHIVYMIEVDLKRNLPVIGEENMTKATQITFVKDPPIFVAEDVIAINHSISRE